ncbi:hypothetical protein BDW62DRAFT_133094 [Aspergillus aurantiobrunneus]
MHSLCPMCLGTYRDGEMLILANLWLYCRPFWLLRWTSRPLPSPSSFLLAHRQTEKINQKQKAEMIKDKEFLCFSDLQQIRQLSLVLYIHFTLLIPPEFPHDPTWLLLPPPSYPPVVHPPMSLGYFRSPPPLLFFNIGAHLIHGGTGTLQQARWRHG